MQKSFSKVGLGNGEARFLIKYTSDPCEPGSIEARQMQIRALKTLTDSPELMICGFQPFQKFSMRHTGEHWLLELEAVGPE